jgi:asparagine synthase (glutamine-hydrolysing)
MTTTISERAVTADAAAWHAHWIVAAGRDLDVNDWRGSWRRWTAGSGVFAIGDLHGSDLRVAEDTVFVLVFSGLLTNVEELEPGATQADAARITLRLVQRHGADGFAKLRGPFAVIAWNRLDGSLMVARDQVGLEPIFHARVANGWLLSRSPDALAAHPGVSGEPDAVALSEWLCGWFPAVEDTTYRAVKRVPPGTALTLRGTEIREHRYWDPFADAGRTEWLKEEDLDEFEPCFARAVGRSVAGLPPAIFLSGGLDSIAVSIDATDHTRSSGMKAPLALSLVFPDAESNEEPIQAGVASQLGLAQMLVPFERAIPGSLLREALRLSAASPQPIWNMWAPAYVPLAQAARQHGCRVVLTGRGGDEWLTVSPYLLADQLRRGDLAGAARLIRTRQQSNGLAGLQATGRLVWRTAGRPLASAMFDAVAPSLWHQRRRRRLLGERPAWVAPDPSIRRAMDERIDRFIDPARPAGGFYQREARTTLRHPAITHDMEETQEFGRQHGLRMLHPFWDVDLIELLRRVPPQLLAHDGRSKWLLRRKVAQRLPGLGLERRGKASAANVFRDILDREAPVEWSRLRGAPALERIGAVRTADMDSGYPARTLVGKAGGAGRLYTLLNLEAWVQQRA